MGGKTRVSGVELSLMSSRFGLQVWGIGYGVLSIGYRASDLGYRVWGLGMRAKGVASVKAKS